MSTKSTTDADEPTSIEAKIEQEKYPWRSESILHYCYVEKGMSLYEVAETLDCGHSTVGNWLDKHGIATRDVSGRDRDTTDAAWKDRETLSELYWEQGLSTREVATELDCGEGTIREWLNRTGLGTREPTREVELTEPYHDAEVLESLHLDEELSTYEVADELGCSPRTILRNLRRHDIPVRDGVKGKKVGRASYLINPHGYEQWVSNGQHGPTTAYVHQLTAVAQGEDPHEIWADDTHVHHRCPVPWLNVPGFVDVVSPEEHGRLHSEGEFVEEEGIPVLALPEEET